jgi:hypothetical protein
MREGIRNPRSIYARGRANTAAYEEPQVRRACADADRQSIVHLPLSSGADCYTKPPEPSANGSDMPLQPALVATLAAALLASTSWAEQARPLPRTLEIFGWVERVELLDGQISLKAKLDTGARTSSLDATNIERFSRDGERYVRFVLADPDTETEITLERPLVRNVRIVSHSGENQRRAVVTLPICYGPWHEEIEFSLIDRSNFIYPVLLGRSALEGRVLVDSEATFANYPDCDLSGDSG